jgi:transposase InsO family protein
MINAWRESFFATLECELFDQQPGGRFTTRREAKPAIFDFLEAFYNPRPRHSSLGQVSPAAFEARHNARPAACPGRLNEVSAKAGQLQPG